MNITRMDTSQLLSRAVIHNDTIYLAGLTADEGHEGIKEQTRNVLEKIEILLAQAGSDKMNILRATLFIKDMKYFDAMNEMWEEWIPEGRAPARATVEAKLAYPHLLIEIVVTAASKK